MKEKLQRLAERSTSPSGMDRDALSLPQGGDFQYEYRSGDDGAGSISQDADGKQRSEFRPCSQWRRAVGPWERV